MRVARLASIAVMLLALCFASFGCDTEDGGVTDPPPPLCEDGAIIVEPDQAGSIQPIVDAIAAASPGDLIQIEAGIYDGVLIIDKPVYLQGCSGFDHTLFTAATDTIAVTVDIDPNQYSSTDSLIIQGITIGNAGLGMKVERSGATIAFRETMVSGNSTTGLQIGDGVTAPPGDPTIVMWRCFFDSNGKMTDFFDPPGSKAAIWSSSTINASSILFEDNRKDMVFSAGSYAYVERLTSEGADESCIWVEGGANVDLVGTEPDSPPEIRKADGVAAWIESGSRLAVSGYLLKANAGGGFFNRGGTLIITDTELTDNLGWGLLSVDGVDSLSGVTVFNTKGLFGVGIAVKDSLGGDNLLYMEDCAVTGSFFGGIFASGSGMTVEVHGGTINGNGSATENFLDPSDPGAPVGAGIKLTNGATGDLQATTIRSNTASRGGGIAVLGSTSSVELTGVTFISNVTTSHGGALYVEDGSAVIDACVFDGNGSSGDWNGVRFGSGGAIAGVGAQNIEVKGQTVFAGNRGKRGGGAVSLERSPASFTNGIQFIENESNRNGDGKGGAFFISNSPLTLRDARLEGNSAGFGGCIFATHLNEDITIEDCNFPNNAAGRNAAVVFAEDLTRNLTFKNCVMVNNRLNTVVSGTGSVIFSRNDVPGGRLILDQCTLADNLGGEAAIYHSTGSMTIRQTLVAFNGEGGLVGSDLVFVEFSCNDFFGNDGNNYGNGVVLDPESFSEDPLFCDPQGNNYTVFNTSPCLPANNSCGALVGALGEGCQVQP